MTRKRIFALSALLASAALLLASCNNLLAQISGNDSDSGDTSRAQTLTATVTGISEATMVEQLRNDARTVKPDPYDLVSTNLSGSGALIFVLSGESTNGSTIGPKQVTITTEATAGVKTDTGKVEVAFPDSSTWTLTLTAYKKLEDSTTVAAATGVDAIAYKDTSNADKICSNPVLTATTNADLRNGVPSDLTFKMNVKGLRTPGSLSFYDGRASNAKMAAFAYNKDSPTIQYIKIGLYDVLTGKAIYAHDGTDYTNDLLEVYLGKDKAGNELGRTITGSGTGASADVIELPKSNTPTPVTNTTYYAFFPTSAKATVFDTTILPGEYILGITFYNAENSNIGFYSDDIIIAPGNTTYFTDLVDSLNEIPVAPTYLGAQLVSGSENDDTYEAKFNWTDNAKNETNFELQLYEVGYDNKITAFDASNSKNDLLATLCFKTTTTLEDTKANWLEDYDETSEYYAGGSLFANSESVTLKLKTGKLYEVRLRAINTLGESDWVYRLLEPTSTTGLDTGNEAYKVSAATANTTPDIHINRVKIFYDYSEYKYTLDEGSGENAGEGAVAASYPKQLVIYDTYTTTDIPLIKGNTRDTTTQLLTDTENDIVTIDKDKKLENVLLNGKYAFKYKDKDDYKYLSAKSFEKWIDLNVAGNDATATERTKTDAYKDIEVKAYFTTKESANVETYSYNDINLTNTPIVVRAFDDLTATGGIKLEATLTAGKLNTTDTKATVDLYNTEYTTYYRALTTTEKAATTVPSDITYYTSTDGKNFTALDSAPSSFDADTTYYVEVPLRVLTDTEAGANPVDGAHYYTKAPDTYTDVATADVDLDSATKYYIIKWDYTQEAADATYSSSKTYFYKSGSGYAEATGLTETDFAANKTRYYTRSRKAANAVDVVFEAVARYTTVDASETYYTRTDGAYQSFTETSFTAGTTYYIAEHTYKAEKVEVAMIDAPDVDDGSGSTTPAWYRALTAKEVKKGPVLNGAGNAFEAPYYTTSDGTTYTPVNIDDIKDSDGNVVFDADTTYYVAGKFADLYSKYRVTIEGDVVFESSDTTKTTATFITSRYRSGKYSCIYSVQNKEDGLWYSKPFILEIVH